MADIGQLVIRIGADASELQRAFDKMGDGGRKFADGLVSAGKVAATAVIAVTTAAVANTLAIAKQVEEIDHLSQKTGIAVQTLQGWSVIMEQNNFQAQTLATSMRTLSKEIVEARDPASAAATTFESLGISITSLGSTEDTIAAVADRFKAMADGPEKAALAIQLFGKAGLDMIPILNKGSEALKESQETARRFGLVLTTENVAALNAVDDASDTLGLALRGLQTAFALAFAPWITDSIKAIVDGIASITFHVKELTGQLEKQDNSAQAFLGRSIVEATQEQLKREAEYQAERDQREEAIGQKLRDRFIRTQQYIAAEGRAQEALGRVQLAIIQRTTDERNKAFAQQVEEEERLRVLSLGLAPPPTSGPFAESVARRNAAVDNLENIGVGVDREDRVEIANEQEAAGLRIVQQSIEAYNNRNAALDEELSIARANMTEQAELYKNEKTFFDAAEVARRNRIRLIEAEADVEKKRIEETIFDEQKKANAIRELDARTNSQRMATAREFPTFWEQQLTQIEQANVFAMGQMVSLWSSSLATMIVKGGDFKNAIDATLIAVVQAFINMAASALASGVKALLVNQAAATGSAVAWEGAATAITGTFAAIGTAISGLWTGIIVPVFVAIGQALMTFLTAIADALSATVFGIPYAGAILLGVAVIAAAVATLSSVKLAEGGVAMGPTLAQIGEGGSPEAVIPLNQRGANFMRKAFGNGTGEQVIQNHLYIDGREVAQSTVRHLPRAMRMQGAPA